MQNRFRTDRVVFSVVRIPLARFVGQKIFLRLKNSFHVRTASRQTNAPAPCNHSSARYASCVFRFRVSNRTVDNCQNMSVFVSPYIAPCLLFFSAWLPLCFLSRSVFVFFGLTRSDCVPVWSACFCVRALACLPANTPASCFHCLPA